ILGDQTDRLPGKLIDILAVIALIAGTATTFSLATPLLSRALSTSSGSSCS
ncbi:MAG: BCCT family transporter, partial [Synergistaceae bacterium]|nr:BCCT family transporter [Synergistaceae bacterium]